MPTLRLQALIDALAAARVEFVIIGGAAAMIQGAPLVTLDLDIVHHRTVENVRRLQAVLTAVRARLRADRRDLAPTDSALLGRGHILLDTTLGPLDVLCELGEGQDYDWLLARSEPVERGELTVRVVDLPTLIAPKTAANRPKDRIAVPILMATLEERSRSPDPDPDPAT